MRSGEFRSPTLKMLATVFGCIVLVSGASEARSQSAQYAAKYVCGAATSNAGTPGAGIVAPGAYFTSINVHNPNKERSTSRKYSISRFPASNRAAE